MAVSGSNAGAKLPGPVAAPILAWRAGRIQDPVARLRFLRKSTRILLLDSPSARRKRKLAIAACVFALLCIPVPTITKATSSPNRATPSFLSDQADAGGKLPDIWQVEKKPDYEVYSNGLRVETRGATFEEPRKFTPLDKRLPDTWGKPPGEGVALRTAPVGIVFHTTESHLAPFAASQNGALQRLGKELLTYVRRHRSYHYLVDRFGRVHRVVEEESIANHAGWSIWADRDWVYVNVNHSFLGVAFEAQTRPQDGVSVINDAQRHAGRTLTDMLRSKYRIAARNAITHAQVSVNPDNFIVGNHTDWATNFPFSDMGLPDNYTLPLPSMTLFGFRYDSSYAGLSGQLLMKGLRLAEEEVRQQAVAQSMKIPAYRTALQRRYQQTIQIVKQQRNEGL